MDVRWLFQGEVRVRFNGLTLQRFNGSLAWKPTEGYGRGPSDLFGPIHPPTPAGHDEAFSAYYRADAAIEF